MLLRQNLLNFSKSRIRRPEIQIRLKRSNRANGNSAESESVIQYLVRLIEISNYEDTLIRSDGRKNADKWFEFVKMPFTQRWRLAWFCSRSEILKKSLYIKISAARKNFAKFWRNLLILICFWVNLYKTMAIYIFDIYLLIFIILKSTA